MKNSGIFIILMLFLIIFSIFTCKSFFSQDDLKVIKISGPDASYNYGRKYGLSAVTAINGQSAVIAKKNDVLAFAFDKDTIMYRLKNADLKEYKFKKQNNLYYLNEKIICIDIDNEGKALDEAVKLTKNDLKELQIVNIQDELNQENKNKLKNLMLNIPSDCLINSVEIYKDNTAKLKPEFLYLDPDNIADFLASDFAKTENTSVKNIIFHFSDSKVTSLDFLSNFKNLESLTIFDWLTEIKLPADFKIQKLYIFSSDIKDLKPINNLKNLKELTVCFCPEFKDALGISEFADLNALDFSYCDIEKNREETLKLKKLKYLSYPAFDQKYLDSVVSGMPDLAVLEIFDTEGNLNLSSVKTLKNLNALVYMTPGDKDHKNLYELNGLKYLFVSSDLVKNNSASFEELKKTLDKTEIFTVTGICLGSGYILLIMSGLLIFILIMLYAQRKKRN